MAYIEVMSAAAAGLFLYHKHLQQKQERQDRTLQKQQHLSTEHLSTALPREGRLTVYPPSSTADSAPSCEKCPHDPSLALGNLPGDAMASLLDYLEVEDVARVSAVNGALWRQGRGVVADLWDPYCKAAHSNLGRMGAHTAVKDVKREEPSLPHFKFVGSCYVGAKRQLEEIEKSRRHFHLKLLEQKKLVVVQTFMADVRDALIRFSLAWFSTLLVSCLIAHNLLLPSCLQTETASAPEIDSDPVDIVLDLLMINALLFLYFWSTQRGGWDLFLSNYDGLVDVDVKPAGLFALTVLMSMGALLCAVLGWRKSCTEPWAQKHQGAFLLSAVSNCVVLVLMQFSARFECCREWIVEQYEYKVVASFPAVEEELIS